MACVAAAAQQSVWARAGNGWPQRGIFRFGFNHLSRQRHETMVMGSAANSGRIKMQMSRSAKMVVIAALAGAAMVPVAASATVKLQVAAVTSAPCYSDSPACDRSITAPLRAAVGDTSLPDPAVAAIVGLAVLGMALGRRRTGLEQVVS
jgi:hypothetical protein